MVFTGLMKKAKEGGLDVIQTYVFWNGHEPKIGEVSVAFCITDNCFIISYYYYNVLV